MARIEDLLKDVQKVMGKAGFEYFGVRAGTGQSFDMVSRREERLLVMKLIMDRNDLSSVMANEMLALSRVLKASPLIIIPSRNEVAQFHDGVLYIRLGIPLMTFNTLFDHMIEEIPPMVYEGHGGFFVSIDGDRLRARREELKISLGALADKVHVSRKAIQMYESGMGADIETAIDIESVLHTKLIRSLDPFSYSDELQNIRDGYQLMEGMKKEVIQHLDSLGMEVIPTESCPFDALAKGKDDLIITSISGKDRGLKEKAVDLASMGRITGGESVFIMADNARRRNIDGVPVLGLKEVRRTTDIDRLVSLIRERTNRRGRY
ncbi:MAG: transcriptional regulator [Thermoplasmatota archaeon]